MTDLAKAFVGYSAGRRSNTCPRTGQLLPTVPDWAVMIGRLQVCDTAAADEVPELLGVVQRLRDRLPDTTPVEASCIVFPAANRSNTVSIAKFQGDDDFLELPSPMVQRWAAGHLKSECRCEQVHPWHLSEGGLRRLAEFVAELNGTTLDVRPAAPTPPPPTPAQLVERERERLRGEAYRLLFDALTADPVESNAHDRARRQLDAVERLVNAALLKVPST